MSSELLTPEERPEDSSSIRLMLELVQRTREATGGPLGDDAVQAIAEVTGTTPEMVRVLGTQQSENEVSKVQSAKSFLAALDPSMRRYVLCAWLGSIIAVLDLFEAVLKYPPSILGLLAMACQLIAIWVIAHSRDTKAAVIAGTLFAVIQVLGYSLLLSVAGIWLKVPPGPEPWMLVGVVFAGAIGGLLAQSVVKRLARKFGIRTSDEERKELLQQLVSIQDRLKEHERQVAFLSLDVVGSTRMKQGADALAVEFTFSEYHQYVETVARKCGGAVHSTAGDGVTCAFDTPVQAFRAARQIQGGMYEFNAVRNRIGKPVQLRAGIHFGEIILQGSESTDVNFSSVIDIAAHLQKECPVGGVCLSDTAASELGSDRELLEEMPSLVDSVRAFSWQPRAAAALAAAAAPPPLSLPPDTAG